MSNFFATKSNKSTIYLCLLMYFLIFILNILGIMTVASCQADGVVSQLVKKQAVFAISGVFLSILAALVPFKIWKKLSVFLTIFSVSVLLILLRFGIKVNGMRGWYDIGFIFLQPSELFKGFFVLFLAIVFAKQKKNFLYLLAPLIIWLPPVLLQPDLGTATIYCVTFALVAFIAGTAISELLIVAGGAFACGVFFIWHLPYVFQRFSAFFNSEADPLGGGWHIQQCELSIARGGLFGAKVVGANWSKFYLPLPYNDSAFATFCETFGVIGIILLLGCFFGIVYILIRLAIKRNDPVAKLFIIGCAIQISVQFLIHAGVNTGLFPITGLTMPFISYGGSSLAACMILLGMSVSAAMTE